MSDYSVVAAVRARLNAQENEECTDDMVARFIRAERSNVERTTARLKETLQWRRDTRPHECVCRACQQDPRAHYMHPVGFGNQNQPVLYSCFALASDKSVQGNRDHMIMSFERAIKLMKPGVEKWIWFADFVGFGLRDLNPSIGKTFLELASKHYPERLGCFVICGAPAIFYTLFNAILPLMDPVTKAKIRVVPYDIEQENKTVGASKLKQLMHEMLPLETTEWILHEMAENRMKSMDKDKRYCQTEIHAALKAGGAYKKHWGSSDMLERLSRDPEMLLPNAKVQ